MAKQGPVKRPTNRPVQRIFDKRQQIEVRAFDGRQETETIEYTSQGYISKMIDKVKSFFNRFFSTTAISSLDLRAKSPRGEGVMQLKEWWPNLGIRRPGKRLISTRDGKPI